MLKMQREKQNSGMSLVEVIISMLVLSIAVVTVLSAFSMASKTNLQSKKHQCVESLMENFVEYAEAGGTEFAGYFGVTAGDYTVTEAGAIKTETLKNLHQGYFNFDVEVTTDTAPAEYSTGDGGYLNDRPIIQFGGSGSKSVLIDASLKGNDSNNNDICDSDESACNYFYMWHTIEIDSKIADVEAKRADGTYTDAVADAEIISIEGSRLGSADAFGASMDRELWITAVNASAGKMKLQAFFRYVLQDGIALPAGVDKVYTSLIYMSNEYDCAVAGDDTKDKLDQVYVLYSDPVSEQVDTGQDIRILDAASDTEKKLDAILYLVEQEDTLKTYTTDDGTPPQVNVTHKMTQRSSGKEFKVSFNNPETGGPAQTPQKLEIYCSGKAALDGKDGNITYDSDEGDGAKNIVAKGTEVRVVTVTIKVLEQGTGKVLSTKEITRLQ